MADWGFPGRAASGFPFDPTLRVATTAIAAIGVRATPAITAPATRRRRVLAGARVAVDSMGERRTPLRPSLLFHGGDSNARCRAKRAGRTCMSIDLDSRATRIRPAPMTSHARRPSSPRTATQDARACRPRTRRAQRIPPGRRSSAARAAANDLHTRSPSPKRANHRSADRRRPATNAAPADAQMRGPCTRRGFQRNRCRRNSLPRCPTADLDLR